MSENRQIKFNIEVDERSARKTAQIIDDLTRRVEKLAQVGAKALPGLASKSQKNINLSTGNKKGGIVSDILGGNSKELQDLVKTTDNAFRTLTQSLKKFTTEAQRDVSKLNENISKLKGNLGGLKGPKGEGSARPKQFEPSPSLLPIVRDKDMGMWGRFKRHMNNDLISEGPRMGRFREFMSNNAVRAGKFAGIPGAAGLGRFAGAAGVGLGVGMAAVGLYELGARSFEVERQGKLDFELNEPIRQNQRAALRASIGAQSYSAARQGDISFIKAQRDTARRGAIMRSLTNVKAAREAVELGLERGVSIKSVISQAKKIGRGYLSEGTEALLTKLGGMPLDKLRENRSGYERELATALADDESRVVQNYQTAVRSEQALQDPSVRRMLNQTYQNAMGTVATGRQGFLGGGYVTDPNTNIRYHRMQLLESRLTRRGYSLGELAGARREMVTGAGRGYVGLGGRSMGMGAAGVQGVSSLVRAGGIMAGNRAGGAGLLNALQSSVGRGGLDVTVGSGLFQQLAQKNLQLQATGTMGFGMDQSEFFRGVSGLVGGGVGAPLDVAEQQRNQGLFFSGMQQFGGLTQGTTAPLYQATSLIGAISATGGYGALADRIAKMDPTMLMSIARGGEIPPELRSLGMTQDKAVKALNYQSKAPFFETVDRLFKGTETGDALNELRTGFGGNFRDYVRSKTEGLKGRQRAKAIERAVTTLGGAATGGSGALFAMLAADPELAPTLQGRGAFAMGPRGAERAALNDQSRAQMEDARTTGDLKDLTEGKGGYFDTSTERQAGRSMVKAVEGDRDLLNLAANASRASEQIDIFAKKLKMLNDSGALNKILRAR